jgi:hypothetical protein
MTDADAAMPDPPKRKRRWFQFSLRSLLILVMLVSIVCSWGTVRLRRALKRNAAVQTIKEFGGRVFYDYQFDRERQLQSGAEAREPNWERRLLGEPAVENVYGVWFMAGNGGPTRVTDADLERIAVLTEVRSLVLHRCSQVTDAGVAYLAQFKELELLYLTGTRITDAGLKTLEGLSKLRTLDLDETAISAVGLHSLAKLSNLDVVWLHGTLVTADGVARLRRSLPKTEINWDGWGAKGGHAKHVRQIDEGH